MPENLKKKGREFTASICLGVTFSCVILGTWMFVLLLSFYPEAELIQSNFVFWAAPVISLILAVIVTRFTTNHFDSIAQILFVGTYALPLTGVLLFGKTVQKEHLIELENQVINQGTALQIEIQRQRAEKLAADEEAARNLKLDRFAQYQGKVPLSDLQAIRDLDDHMQAELKKNTSAYEAALKNNPTFGPNRWVRMTRLDELEQQWQHHQELYSKTRVLMQFMESFEKTYQSAIDDLQLKGLSERIAIAEMKRVLQMWESNEIFRLRRLDVELLGSALNAIRVLMDNWGEWQYNPRENRTIFESPAAEVTFFEAVQRMQLIVKEVDTLKAQ